MTTTLPFWRATAALNRVPAVESTSAEPTGPLAAALSNKFLVVILTSQRAKQLENGARARVDGGDHKSAGVALLEVLGGLVSWSVTERPLPAVPRAGGSAS